MGSGKHLKRSVNKYGIENFNKEILFIFDNEFDMNCKESELVTEEFCLREDTYNICVGGKGGFGYINANYLGIPIEEQRKRDPSLSKRASKAGCDKLKEMRKTDEYKLVMKQTSIKAVLGLKEKYPNGTFHGKTHSDDTKALLSASAKGKHDGEKNSQFGKSWYTNGADNIKLKSDDVIPEGFHKGRILKKVTP